MNPKQLNPHTIIEILEDKKLYDEIEENVFILKMLMKSI